MPTNEAMRAADEIARRFGLPRPLLANLIEDATDLPALLAVSAAAREYLEASGEEGKDNYGPYSPVAISGARARLRAALDKLPILNETPREGP